MHQINTHAFNQLVMCMQNKGTLVAGEDHKLTVEGVCSCCWRAGMNAEAHASTALFRDRNSLLLLAPKKGSIMNLCGIIALMFKREAN